MVIDMRMRPPLKEYFPIERDWGPYVEPYVELFKGEVGPEQLIAIMDEAGIEKGVIIAEDAETTWRPKVPNEVVADLVNKSGIISCSVSGFGSTGPLEGPACV